MTNYIIEGNINFYDELYKSLDDEDDQNHVIVEPTKSNECCLISGSPLIDNYVTLDCNHKFNYVPLFNDIYNHKKKYNALERKILKIHEIRCPYCRNIQNKLLPYHEDMCVNMNVEKVHGVNFIDETLTNKKYTDQGIYVHGTCCFEYVCNNGEKVNCTHNTNEVTLIGEKYYCVYHSYYGKYALIKAAKLKQKMELKQKMVEAKQKLLEAKNKIKDEKNKIKEAKNKAKEEAKKAKEEAKKAKSAKSTTKNKHNIVIDLTLDDDLDIEENIIISSTSSNTIFPGCHYLLTSGKNTGRQCCCKKIHSNNVCLRHYTIMEKKETFITQPLENQLVVNHILENNYGNPDQAHLWLKWVMGVNDTNNNNNNK